MYYKFFYNIRMCSIIEEHFSKTHSVHATLLYTTLFVKMTEKKEKKK